MVDKLKIRHPDFADRLQKAAGQKKIGVKDLAKSITGITYEMARRYWIGAAKPRGQKMVELAHLVGLAPAVLEYGPHGHAAHEPAVPYSPVLNAAAMDVARAWSKLSPSMQRLYREAMFRDAATENALPFLKTLVRPASTTYDAFEKAVERDYQQHVRQLKLEL